MRIKDLTEDRICKTPGTHYDTSIKSKNISVKIKLPPQVSIGDMTDQQGDRFDDMIHDAMEKIVAKIIYDTNDDANEMWNKARENDPT